jgi:hypothetical protein
MSTEKMKGIVDTPIQKSDQDAFGINKYVDGLIEFIKNTETPITIALQGEWGSGKTSLMNTLKNKLCENEERSFTGIWINTWQYSLMKDPEQTLVSIILALTEQLSKHANDKNKEEVKRILKGLLKISFSIAGKFVGANLDSDVFYNEQEEKTVLKLRDALNELICHSNKEYIFFIDDLDRLEPPVAVKVLELLKNIFDLNHSIFILAIDYDVVVKGLEPKFGKHTAENEREFRSFFDKIIQLPFTMPLGSYVIDDFLISNLKKIDFLDEKDKEDDIELKELLSNIARFSLGTNPRSLKRLLNSLSLVACINKSNYELDKNLTDTTIFKVFSFSMMCIQISYPQIYLVLQKFPDFPKWNQDAIKMELPEISIETVKKLKETEEFDEEWEQVLYRICEKDNNTHLKRNALNISALLNLLKDFVTSKEENNICIESLVKKSIGLSAVTSVNTSENQFKEIDSNLFLSEFVSKVFEKIKMKLHDKQINRKGNKLFFDDVEIDFRAPIVYDQNKPDDRRMLSIHKTRNDKDIQKTKELLENKFMTAMPQYINERHVGSYSPTLIMYNYIKREKNNVKDFYEEKMVELFVTIIVDTHEVIEYVRNIS